MRSPHPQTYLLFLLAILAVVFCFNTSLWLHFSISQGNLKGTADRATASFPTTICTSRETSDQDIGDVLRSANSDYVLSLRQQRIVFGALVTGEEAIQNIKTFHSLLVEHFGPFLRAYHMIVLISISEKSDGYRNIAQFCQQLEKHGTTTCIIEGSEASLLFLKKNCIELLTQQPSRLYPASSICNFDVETYETSFKKLDRMLRMAIVRNLLLHSILSSQLSSWEYTVFADIDIIHFQSAQNLRTWLFSFLPQRQRVQDIVNGLDYEDSGTATTGNEKAAVTMRGISDPDFHRLNVHVRSSKAGVRVCPPSDNDNLLADGCVEPPHNSTISWQSSNSILLSAKGQEFPPFDVLCSNGVALSFGKKMHQGDSFAWRSVEYTFSESQPIHPIPEPGVVDFDWREFYGSTLYPTESCFGGWATYRTQALRVSECQYSFQSRVHCEHVAFHACLKSRGFGRQYLDPLFVYFRENPSEDLKTASIMTCAKQQGDNEIERSPMKNDFEK